MSDRIEALRIAAFDSVAPVTTWTRLDPGVGPPATVARFRFRPQTPGGFEWIDPASTLPHLGFVCAPGCVTARFPCTATVARVGGGGDGSDQTQCAYHSAHDFLGQLITLDHLGPIGWLEPAESKSSKGSDAPA